MVNLGSTWDQLGVNLGSTCTALPGFGNRLMARSLPVSVSGGPAAPLSRAPTQLLPDWWLTVYRCNHTLFAHSVPVYPYTFAASSTLAWLLVP
jgi:hypothetical protein